MPLVPSDPYRHLSNLKREFDHFFSDFPISFENEQQLGGIQVGVHETDSEVVVP